MEKKKLLKKTLNSWKKSFQRIIEPGSWKTDAQREAIIRDITGRKRFPLKELIDSLASCYNITGKRTKAEYIDLIGEILLKKRAPGTAEQLLNLLKTTVDPDLRIRLTKLIPEFEDDRLIAPIVAMMRSPKRMYRSTAISLLDHFPTDEVGRILAEELQKGEWPVRSEALNYLFEVSREHVAGPCRQALEIGTENDKSQALKLLSAVKTPEAVRAMEYVVEDESPKIRMQVAKIFGNIRSNAALRSLIVLAADPKPDVVLTALDGLREHASPAALPVVQKCLKHDNFKIRIQSIETIGIIGTADEVPALVDALKDQDIRIRQAALDALIALSRKEDTDISKFVSLLMSDPDVNVRRAAAKILGQVDAPGLFEKLFDYLKDEDWWVRETIAETLSRLKDDRIYPAAVELLSSSDQSLRRYAIEIMIGLEDPRALVPLIKMLKDPDWWVRERAIYALGVLGNEKIIPILTNLLNIEELVYVAAEALGNIGHASAIPHLLQTITRADDEAKIIIMNALEKLQAREAVPLLETLVTDPNREVRSHAKEVLARMKVDLGNLTEKSSKWWEQHEFSLLDSMLMEVQYQKGTDLFLISNNPAMARIRGEMIPLTRESLSEDQIMSMLGRILTPDQEATYMEKHDLDFSYEIASEGRFRGNIFRHANGMNLVFRVLPDEVPSLDELQLLPFVKTLVNYRHGLVLFTGPSSCGKSTTMAALVNEINHTRLDNIITIEDPIEYIHYPDKCLVIQREIGRHTAGFAQALRAALREDPDVIVVGELRDLATISMALTAAETGHYVLASLHSISAFKSIDRILDVFPTGQQEQIRIMLSESLRAIISQQLVDRADGGQVVAMEVMVNTPAISTLIRENKLFQIPAMIMAGREHGMNTMDQALVTLMKNGVITPEEALLRAYDKNQFESIMKEYKG